MKQQSVHPDDAAGTSDASSRPNAADGDDKGAVDVSKKDSGAAPPPAEKASPKTYENEKPQVERDEDDLEDAHAEEVEGDEPLLPARVHRPSDLMRLSVGILGIIVLLAIAAFAHGTTSGLEQDISKGTGQAPDLLIKLAGLGSSIAILLVPVAFAIERLIKRDGLRIADGVLAAVLAHGVTLATDLWVARAAPDSIQEALTQPSPATSMPLPTPCTAISRRSSRT